MTILDTIDQEFLFQVIEHNGDISPLLKKYNYTKVASALKFLIEKGYAKYDKEELRITEAGRAEHDKLKKILQRKHNGNVLLRGEYISTNLHLWIYSRRSRDIRA